MSNSDRSAGRTTAQLKSLPCCQPPRPCPLPTNWARYPAQQNVDMDCYRLEDVSGITFCDGTTLNTGTTPLPTDWSQYPATQKVDVSCNRIVDVSGVNFCDGTYIGSGNSFDISSNQVLVLSGTPSTSGAYSGASVISRDRIYQQVDSDPSWNAVNGYYALAKDAAPALNPNSSGVKAISTWVARTSASDNGWQSICWSPELGLFVATAINTVNSVNRIATSPDGINWTGRLQPEIFQITGCNVVSGNNISCNSNSGLREGMPLRILSGSGSLSLSAQIASSPAPTSTTFTIAGTVSGLSNTTLGVDANWSSVCWSPKLGIFVAVSNSNTFQAITNRVMTSTNGITWNLRTTTNSTWNSVCWSAELGIFVAVADSYDNSTPGGGKVMTSQDGISWTTIPETTDHQWSSVCWSAELRLFVAVASGGGISGSTRVMTSPNGINWTKRSTPVNNLNWLSVCWSPELSLFVAVCNNGSLNNSVMTSPDGINWIRRTTPATTGWQSVCWSAELGLFVAVAATFGSANSVMTSPDGISWTIRTTPTTNNWRSVCWSSELGIYAAVANGGSGNRVMTSTLRGSPPTAYNVFDSSSNSIDQKGNWALQQVVKAGAYTAGQTTPSVAGVNLMYITNTASTTITNFTGGVANQRLILAFQTATPNTIIQHNTSIRLSGGANFTPTQYDTLTLLFTGTVWVELYRSLNT